MQNNPNLEALKAELADKEAMLADIRSGKIPFGLGHPSDGREAAIQRRIDELKFQIRAHDAPRT